MNGSQMSVSQSLDQTKDVQPTQQVELPKEQIILAREAANLAIEFTKQGDIQGSIAKYKEAIKLNPFSAKWIYKALSNQLLQSSRVEEAVSIVRQGIEYFPKGSDLYLVFAACCQRQGETRVAIANYRKAISLDDNLPIWVYRELAMRLLDCDQLDEAIDTLKPAVAQFPNSADLYGLLANCFQRQRNFSAAIEMYQKAIEVEPCPLWLYLAYIRLLDENGRLDEVLPIIPRLVIRAYELTQEFPDRPDGFVLMASLCDKLGNTQDAVLYCQKALDLDESLWFNPEINRIIVNSLQLDEDVQQLRFNSESKFIEHLSQGLDKIIIDVGANNGDDTEFYLKKGFKCIAIEADPELCNYITKRLHQYIYSGALMIKNKAISNEEGEITLYKNARSEWSSIVFGNKATSTNTYQEIVVEATTLDSIVERFSGCLHYIKIDIEGADEYAVDALQRLNELPQYVSFEVNPTCKSIIQKLYDLGYREFQVVRQGEKFLSSPPEKPQEGKYVKIKFTGNMSGCFGSELSGEWLDYQQCLQAISELSDARNAGWHDIHAKCIL